MQLCGVASDCTGAGMTCPKINVGPASIGVCMPGDGGTSGEGGGDASDGGSSSGGGDASDTGTGDAPSDTGGG